MFIELVTAIVVLLTALIGLNRAGVVDVPVVSQVPAFQNSGQKTPGGGDIPDINFPNESVKIEVPDVVGLPLEEARATLEGRGLRIEAVQTMPIELCDYQQGAVEVSLPPEGVDVSEGFGVRLVVCG